VFVVANVGGWIGIHDINEGEIGRKGRARRKEGSTRQRERERAEDR
jgi:hypothetical protein